ncbi:hypothetical protein [Kaistia sp. MMO-174]|uniref:hypothetical protein n=1 Tax=Kaistia sp. MMO-174 TaxID=3081256 RepID=UPI003019806B
MDSYLAIAVATLAASIAYFQWRTSHQAVVRDLFEERYKLYLAISEVTLDSLKDFYLHPSDRAKLTNVRRRAQFLFGEEIIRLLDGHAVHLANLDNENSDVRQAHYDAVQDFLPLLNRSVQPYMSMTMKQPGVPEWAQQLRLAWKVFRQ